MDEIINKVANSKLITLNLEDYYPEGERVVFDVKNWLYEGLILKEKDFRESAKNYDWSQYKNTYVALNCSSEAIIPGWAYLLLTTYLSPFAKKIVVGSLTDLENTLYTEIIQQTDFSDLKGLPVIIKGCSNKPVPENASVLLIQKIQPLVKSLFYGEACSSVPLFKRK
ncbi:DUF2480 family protein [Planktosalinus lacus]|uniref:DUF2480 family protein n=1 Tax=Planktosalinus lacus TaxID=1526573 RepID=A0A8J2V5V1_9FLAO|nr:DUF2480 family protein [Planktosalinus lacus]GGD81489.1 hypothetical protein GCM10011312_02320 [Planktosalinus lacus]